MVATYSNRALTVRELLLYQQFMRNTEQWEPLVELMVLRGDQPKGYYLALTVPEFSEEMNAFAATVNEAVTAAELLGSTGVSGKADR